MKKIIDYTIDKRDLFNMNDKDLAELLMYTDRDRKVLDVAEKLYWWCIEEINKRIDNGEIIAEV